MRVTRLAVLGFTMLMLLTGRSTAHDGDQRYFLPVIRQECSPLPPTPFGVQMYGSTGASARSFPHLVDSGASWVRAPIYWEQVEPANTTPSGYDWRNADRVVGAARDGCFHMIVTHSNDPAWAAADSVLPVAPSAFTELAEYLGALVERYDGDGIDDAPGSPVVRYWELYNEPDDTIPMDGARWGYYGKEYAQMLAVVYPAIKAADPQAQVLLGGIAYDWYEDQDAPFFRGFLDDVLRNGGGAYFDIMNFHTYPPFAASWATQGPGLYEKTCTCETTGTVWSGQADHHHRKLPPQQRCAGLCRAATKCRCAMSSSSMRRASPPACRSWSGLPWPIPGEAISLTLV